MAGESHFIEFSKPFIDAAKNIYETMVFTKLEPQKPLMKKDSISKGDITAVLGLSGESGLNTTDYVGGSVVAIDTERDLALIELNVPIDSSNRKSLSIRSGDIGLESKIRVFGYPGIGGDSLTVSSGIISGLDQSQKFSYFKVSADISGGNSGGPVVDNKGQLVGIATALARQEIDCSSGTTCYSDGNGLGLVRPISLLRPLIDKIDDK